MVPLEPEVEFLIRLLDDMFKLVQFNALEEKEALEAQRDAFTTSFVNRNVLKRLATDQRQDCQICAQFLACLYDLLAQPSVHFEKNEQQHEKTYSQSVCINLNMLRVLVRMHFLLLKLDCLDEVELVKPSDVLFELNREWLEIMSFDQFEEEIASMDAHFVFSLRAHACNTEQEVTLVNHEKFYKTRRSTDELVVVFDNLKLSNADCTDPFRFRFHTAVSHLFNLSCDSQVTNFIVEMPSTTLSVSHISPGYARKKGTSPIQVFFDKSNTVIANLTPNRSWSDIQFDIEFCPLNKKGILDAIHANRVQFRAPSHPKAEMCSLQILYKKQTVYEHTFAFLDEFDALKRDVVENVPSTELAEISNKQKTSPVSITGPAKKKARRQGNTKSLYEQQRKQEEEERKWLTYLLNSKDVCGYTLLHLAAFKGFVKLCRYLIQFGVSVNTLDHFGNTPFHWACYSGSRACALLLVDKGVCLSQANSANKTGLDIAKERQFAMLAQDIEGFIERSAIFALQGLNTTLNQNMELIKTARSGEVELLAILLREGADLNGTDEKGNAALHLAVQQTQFECVTLLLRYGANADIINKDGNTPLQIAASMGDVKMADILVRFGNADVNKVGKKGTPPIHASVYRSSPKMLKYLIERGANVNSIHTSNCGKTCLHIAIENAELELIKILIESQANPQCLDYEGRSAMDLTTQRIRQFIEKLVQPPEAKQKKPATSNDIDPLSSSTILSSPQKHVTTPAPSTPLQSAEPSSKPVLLESTNAKSNNQLAVPIVVPTPAMTSSTPVMLASQPMSMELLLKPSRKKRRYISFFPKELCSSPYKYDILLRIPLQFTNSFNENHFHFRLINQGNDVEWITVDNGIKVIKYLRTMCPMTFREIEWRLMFKVCSFHYHRKPFRFQVTYLNPEEPFVGNVPQPLPTNNGSLTVIPNNSIVFESEPFMIVARKKKENDFWTEKDEEETDLPTTTTTSTPSPTATKKKRKSKDALFVDTTSSSPLQSLRVATPSTPQYEAVFPPTPTSPSSPSSTGSPMQQSSTPISMVVQQVMGPPASIKSSGVMQ